jgi:SAM-dependent methyltransferase
MRISDLPRVMQNARDASERALRGARESAYPPGEYVEQESFMRAGEIRALAAAAGIARGVTMLDLCCGVAGPGRLIARELGPDYLGVDASEGAVAIARARAVGLPCRFEVATVPPLPAGAFEVVILLETMLAFPDKRTLVHAVRHALRPGGRFAFTLEEGEPLTAAERERMPGADTVWPVPAAEIRALLSEAGLMVRWEDDLSAAHAAMAERLGAAFDADRTAIAAQIGQRAVDDLVAAHRLWSEWLATGRVRKLAIVALRRPRARVR